MAMKLPVFGLGGEEKGEVDVANAFSREVKVDLIKKAVLAEQSVKRQAYGTDPLAGRRTSAHYHGRRRYRYAMMNREMARMKRIHGSGYLSFRARLVPQATKGRKAHPPKPERNWKEKLNQKEGLNAVLSAVAASAQRDFLASRGHRIEEVKSIPLIAVDDLEKIRKTKEVLAFFEAVGLKRELERAGKRKVRQGAGTARGRRYRRRKGPLIIIKKDDGICRAARNIAGVDVVEVGNLRAEHLAPGAHPGRLCIWTRSAVEELLRK